MTIAQRFDGKAAWAALDRERQALVGALLLELVAASRVAATTLHPGLACQCEQAAEGLLDRIDHELDPLFAAAPYDRPLIPSVFGDWCERLAGCPQLELCAGGAGLACEGLCPVGVPRERLDA